MNHREWHSLNACVQLKYLHKFGDTFIRSLVNYEFQGLATMTQTRPSFQRINSESTSLN